MNPICGNRRLVCIPAGLALAFAAAPAALASPRPRPSGWNKHPPVPASPQPALRFPPGWSKHPPLPAHLHPLATGGTPGWQLTLMAVTIVLLAATTVAIGHPGPGRTAAGRRGHRLSHHRMRPGADPRGQQGERPYPASRLGRDGIAGQFVQDIAAAATVAAGQHRPAPSTTMPRRRTIIAPRLRPRTLQLCAHCQHNPAGFWVSRTSDQTVRRPWCLSCCQWLDPDRYHVIPFDSHGGTRRSR
jgi:hypothetical protein